MNNIWHFGADVKKVLPHFGADDIRVSFNAGTVLMSNTSCGTSVQMSFVDDALCTSTVLMSGNSCGTSVLMSRMLFGTSVLTSFVE